MTRVFLPAAVLAVALGGGVPASFGGLLGPGFGAAQVAAPGSEVDPPESALDERLLEIDEKVFQGSFHQGLEAIRELAREHPGEVEVLWRLSRVKSDVGLEMGEDESRQEELYRSALEVGRRAVEADPAHPEAHLSTAIAAGRAGLVSGIRERVELSHHVLDHAERALELAPDHDVAYHVRGRWHYEVASLGLVARTALEAIYGGLPDASLEEAVEDFRRAIEIHDRVIHRFKLGRTYLEMGEEEKARRELERASRMPVDAPRAHVHKERARELLAEL